MLRRDLGNMLTHYFFLWDRFLMKCANETVTLELKNGGFFSFFLVFALLLPGRGIFGSPRRFLPCEELRVGYERGRLSTKCD